MKRLIAVNPYTNGLGNRMRFTLSALAVSRASGRDFAYEWKTGHKFEPRLTDLWNFNETELPFDSNPFELTEAADLTQLDHLDDWIVRSGQILSYDGTEEPWTELFADLVPVPRIQQAAADLRRRLPERFVAVQLRLGGVPHAATLEASPLEWFLQKMREAPPDTAFFLSSDDPQSSSRVLAEFPNVIEQRKTGRVNSHIGVEEACVDLYVMAQAQLILGAHYSSFSRLAQALSRGTIDVETSRARYRGWSG